MGFMLLCLILAIHDGDKKYHLTFRKSKGSIISGSIISVVGKSTMEIMEPF